MRKLDDDDEEQLGRSGGRKCSFWHPQIVIRLDLEGLSITSIL